MMLGHVKIVNPCYFIATRGNFVANIKKLKKGTKKHNETGEHDIKNQRKLQIPRGNNKPQEIYEKPNIRIKKKGRGGTPNHPHYSWGTPP